ncbi:COA6 [Symbiodinium microadriaticum]|nr:COA6 [Symbiodinium sp. KB8]CAE7180951.1 COA6 [Symbiodinium microadriaticum]
MANGAKRRECWASRDAFFACLDQGDGQMGPEAEKRCAKEWIQFQKRCLPSWVKHFVMQRNLGQPGASSGA